MGYVLRDYQVQASDAAVRFFNNTKSDRNGILVLPTGCHVKGSLVLKKSGDLVKVEDVKVGDILMGDDGTGRMVKSLHNGIDDMYRIFPTKGEPFVVNGGHILHLYKTNEGKKRPSSKPRYDEISVREYVTKSAFYKHLHKLHRSQLVEFAEEAALPLHPYFIGLYLGDGGSTNGACITTQREEVVSYLYGFAKDIGVSVMVALKNKGLNKAKSYYFPLKKSHANPLTVKIRELGLEHKTAGEKFIPQIYKAASVENRYLLLAGLLDTDAYYDDKKNTFEYCSKSKQLADDVVFLCRSLGLYALIGKTKFVKGVAYYRIQISGDLDLIPTKVAIRKGRKRRQKKSPLITGFSVEHIGKGEYYGFTLDGNHLYLDAQFFVHHNSGKSLIVADIASRLHQNVLVLQPSREILAQNYAKYKSYGMDNCSIYSASFNSKEISEVTFATIGSIMAHIDDFDHFKAIVIDECFPYKQFISTEIGQKRIGYLYKLFVNGHKLPKVLSYNEKTRKMEPNKIIAVKCNGVKTIYKMHFNGGTSVKVTGNHPFLTLEGWKAVNDLKVGDAVMSAHVSGSHIKIPNRDQIDFVLGSMIGDGSLDKTRKTLNVNRLRFIQGEKQKEYLEWKADMLGCADSIKYIEHNGFSGKPAYQFSSKVMYLPDSMCSKEYAIEHLTPKSLAVIYMDDGHLAETQNYATICCVAESEELTILFVEKLHSFGIDCSARVSKSSSSGREYHYIGVRSSGVKTLCELIAPYVHPSMKYKLIDELKNVAGCYNWDKTFSDFGCSVLLGKESAGEETVYNMEVENAHTYVIATGKYEKANKGYANGLIVHNCHGVNPVEGQYATFIRKVKRKVLGLTATPYRLTTAQGIETKDKGFMPNGSYKSSDYFIDDFHPKPGVVMKNACILKFLTRTRPRIFHDVLYEVSIQTLLQRGYLAKLRYFDMTTIDTSRVKRNSTGRDYDEQSLSEEFSRCGLGNQLSDIVKRLLHPKNGVPRKGILVFTQFITESEQLQREIEGVEIVTGATKKKERDRILEDFKSGKIKVLTNVGVLTCLSNDTEILTRNKGWVGIDDIEELDLVAQYDEYTEEISFAHPIRIVKKEFKENFISIEGRYMNFKVTHDHNMIYRKRGIGKIGNPIRCKALELPSVKNPYIPVSGFACSDLIAVQQEKRCTDKRFLATNSYNYRKKGMSHEGALKAAKLMLERRNLRRYKNPNELSLDECRFIGFWLGDGCVVDNKEGKRYSLSQSYCNPNMILWVEELLNKCGIHYNRQFYKGKPEHILGRKCNVSDHVTYNLAIGTGGHKQSVESNLYSLLPYLHKQGSDLYWGLSREQFFCIMEGYFKANGYHGNNKDYKGQRSVGANKELFDLLQAIGVCRGYRISVTEQKPRAHAKKKLYRISLGDYRYHQMVNDKAIIIPNTSKEQVWCVTMPKGAIVTRRKGKVTIMGNCGFDYPELDTVVMARPTMSLAMWYQIVGRAIRPFPGKDGWIVDLGENIKRFGRVDDLSLRMDKPGEYYISGVVNGQYKQLTNKYF